MTPTAWLAVATGLLMAVGAAAALIGARWARQARRGPAPTRWIALLLLNAGVLALCAAAATGVALVVAWRSADRADAQVQAFLAGLHDLDPDRRAQAAAVAGANGWPAAREPLVAMLDDPSPVAREAAIKALGQLGGALAPDEIRLLHACLLTEHLGPAQAAHEAFEALGAAALPTLEQDLATGGDDVRIGAAAALVAMGQPGRQALTRALTSPFADLRRAAVLAIGWHALEAGPWQSTIMALSDPEPRVRWVAAWAYLRMRPSFLPPEVAERNVASCETVMAETLRAWLPAAEGDDRWDGAVARDLARRAGERPWIVRKQLDAALAEAESARPLIPALRHLTPAEETAVPRLLELLWRPAVRAEAIAALRALGGPTVAARLQSIAGTSRVPYGVREACREALAGIELPPAPAPLADPPGGG